MPSLKIDKPQHLWQLAFEGAWVTSVAFVGSHNRLVAGNRLGQVLMWELPEEPDEELTEQAKKDKRDAPSIAPMRMLQGHNNAISGMLTGPDGKTLITASLDRTVRFWDTTAAATSEAEIVLDREQREQEAKRAPKEKKDAILNAPGVMLPAQTSQHTLDAHAEWVKALDLSRDGKRLITGDDACRTIVWDYAARKPIAEWTGHPMTWVSSAALSPDGGLAFVGEYCFRRGDFDRPPAQARLFDASTGEEKIDLLKVQFPDVKERDNSYGYSRTWGKFVKNGFVAARFSPNGKLLALGQGGETDTGQVHLIDPTNGKVVRTVSGHRYGVTDVLFSDDGEYVVSTGRDTTVRICKVADGKEAAALGKPRGGQFKDWLHAIALSPDQRYLAAADMAGCVHVWRLSV